MLQYTVVENTVVKYNKNREEYYTIPMYSANAIEIKFILDDSWKEYVITAQISNGEKTYNLFLQNNTAFIPADITAGIWNVSIFGVKGEEKRNTTIPSNFIVVNEGFKDDGQPAIPPEPDLYQKLLSEIQKGIDIAQSVKDDADAGVFDGNGIKEIKLLNKVDKVATYKIIFTNDTEFDYQITDGTDGINGVDGVGIEKIELVEKIGKTAKYKITLTDGNYFEYEVLDGENGKDGITPEITVNATVNNSTGTPNVSVEKTGTIENPIFNLSFENLKGEKGENGQNGNNGTNGIDGKSATITIGTVTTVSPDTPASVTNTGTDTDAIFNFEIPKGADGSGASIDYTEVEKLAIKTTIEGNPAKSGSSAEWRIPLIEAYGKSTQEADPTPEAPQDIKDSVVTGVKVTGFNLLDAIKDKCIYHFKTSWGAVQGTQVNKTSTNYSVIFEIPVKNNTVYSFYNETNSDFWVSRIIEADDNDLGYVNHAFYANFGLNKKRYSFTTNAKTTKLIFQIWTPDKTEFKDEYFDKMQIAFYEGDYSYYEPYKEKTISLSAPITLRGIPSESGNVTIDGVKHLSDVIDKEKVTRYIGYIASYNGEDVGDLWMSTTGQLTTGATVIYALTEPTTEPLPIEDVQALAELKTFYPSSIISWETEDGSGAWTKAEIIHDPKNYIDEKLTEITAQQTALQAEILKIGGSI